MRSPAAALLPINGQCVDRKWTKWVASGKYSNDCYCACNEMQIVHDGMHVIEERNFPHNMS